MVADGEGRADSPFGIVAERRRRAEDSHDGVADELLDDAAERLELLADGVMVGVQEGAHVLRIEVLRLGGEADEIDEDDADDPPLLVGGGGDRGAAREAEPGGIRVLLAAYGTCGHGRRVRRR